MRLAIVLPPARFLKRSLALPALSHADAAAPLLYLATIVLIAFLILTTNGGVFTYTLDDAYIHLALAENLQGGHYGVNASELSAPSSSIIWAVLLALGGAHEYTPLGLGALASLGTLIIAGWMARRVWPEKRRLQFAGTIAFALGTNLIGLTFQGMEHTLQVFAGALLIAGLIRERERRDLGLVSIALVLNPLVRYENWVLCLPVFIYLLLRRYVTRRVVALMLASAAGPICFSLFLRANGLESLPTSILAKAGGLSASAVIEHALSMTGLRLLLLLGWLIYLFSMRRDRDLVLLGLLFGGGFLALGTSGRYDWFVIAALLLLVGYCCRHYTVRGRIARLALVAVAGWFLFEPTLALFRIVPSTGNVYEQQYQMHRFLTEYWQQPMAVNDLGWTSYRNEAYVLDVGGLASLRALRLRATASDLLWIPALMREHGVETAVLYENWFPGVGDHLIDVAAMQISGQNLVLGGDTVHFYALNEAAASALREQLTAFAPTLPAGVMFDFAYAE